MKKRHRSSSFKQKKGSRMTSTAAPEHLTAPTAAWFEAVVAEYALEEHHVRLLTLAAEAFDRSQQAREALREQGLFIEDRFGQLRPHPAVAVERDSRIAFARLIRELNLEGEPAPGASH
jgi:phage terminase small subunit